MNALDKALATQVMGYEFFELDYWDDETAPRQKELKEWLDRIEDEYNRRDRDLPVGDYYINVEKNICIPVEDFQPSVDLRHAWQMLENLRSRDFNIVVRSRSVNILRQFDTWECDITNGTHHTAAEHRDAEKAICQAVWRFKRDWGISCMTHTTKQGQNSTGSWSNWL